MQENICVSTEPGKIKMAFFDYKLIKLKAALACLNSSKYGCLMASKVYFMIY
jgi:hypothetical protein